MERGICNRCNKFFVKDNRYQQLCNDCLEKDRREYEIIKEHLIANKGASIMTLYLETKIPIKTIERFIREERIKIMEF